MAANFSGGRIDVGARGRKDPLPFPFARGTWVLAPQRVGKGHETAASAKVVVVLVFHEGKVGAQAVDKKGGQYGSTVFLSLATANDNFSSLEIDVFHSQLQCLQETQPSTV